MKIAIVGAGAIGCLYGAYLSRQNEVAFICRRRKVADSINHNGIVVYEPDGSKETFQTNVSAFVSGECREPMDLVIIIVKGADTETAVTSNMGMIDDHTMVMTLQNGAGNDGIIAKYIPMERIIIGTTRHNVVNLDNGNIRHSGGGATYIGSNIEGTQLEYIAELFREAGFETIVSENIQQILWSKLFVNLSINAFTAITKTQIGTLIDNRYAWFFAEKMICEAIDVAEAEGMHFSYRDTLNAVHDICETVSTGFSSMSQDVMNCRTTEIDVINGFVVKRAQAHNVPAPYNQFVVNLIHAIENTYHTQKKDMEKYAQDEVIIHSGDMCDCVYKVMQGSVSLYTDYQTEKEYLFGVYAADRFFGECSCLSNQPNLFTVVANEDTIVMRIPKDEVHNYISVNPLNAESMLKDLSRQTAMLVKNIEMVKGEKAG